MLKITNLTVTAKENAQEILKDFNLEIKPGEIHVLMGPNGIGKSTICKTIFNHPDYEIKKGTITYNNEDLTKLTPTEISRLGIFLLNQNPIEISGITTAELLRNVLSETTNSKVDIPKEFVHRDINFNMSGGEKKKMELLQILLLEPKFIILDEIDSGLDVDSTKLVGQVLQEYFKEKEASFLIITHHQDILNYFPNYQVHILENGKIIKSE